MIMRIESKTLHLPICLIIVIGLVFSSTLFTFSKSYGAIVNLPVTAITASGNDGNVPARAFDNNLATRWSNNGLGSWIQADLGSPPKAISYVDIAWYRGTIRTNTFDISVSNDGAAFTKVFQGKNSLGVNGLERYDFADSNGRFVRVTVTGNTENNYASINEIDIYGSNKVIEGLPTNKSYDKNVLIIKYFPLTKDRTVDINVTGEQYLEGMSYETVKKRTIDISNNLVSAVGKATSYLGYKDSSAKPAIRYHINETIEHEQPVPIAPKPGVPDYADYNGIMQTHNICNYVDNKKIDEVWLFAYQGFPQKLGVSESKMSGPHGDISNSYKFNDMPVCKSTYIVYTFNYARGTAEALHNFGHQMEAQLSEINSHLFRDLYQGPNLPPLLNVNGRCGSVHYAPNAIEEYGDFNPNPWPSDCLDWTPDGLGKLSPISCNIWGCIDRSETDNPGLNYMTWNWQNLPGINNIKKFQGQELRNWWDVYGDFDEVMANSKKLTR